jgi:hypothetical protein
LEFFLAPELAFLFVPRFYIDVAHDRIEQKKTGLVAGTVSSLLSRPSADDIQMLSVENRLEPIWVISATARTVYDRNRTYNLTVGGPEVERVTLLSQEIPVDPKLKDGPGISLQAVEHCQEERRADRTFDGLSGERCDASRFISFPKTLVVDLDQFAPEGVLVIPPQVRATAIVRQVLSEVIRPVQQAQVIHQELVNVETLELNFRPVFAFEYEWSAKAKRSVIEFDALTGEIRGGGRKLSAQVKGIITRDLLFDLSADAASMLVPGGGIAVKLVKAVVDRQKKS